MLTKRLYDKHGRLLDYRLFPTMKSGAFHGRPSDRIRFNVGDKVLVLARNYSKLTPAIVAQTPVTDLQFQAIAEEMRERGKNLFAYDDSDDAYTILFDVESLDGLSDEQYHKHHNHIDALRLFPKDC